MKEKIWPHLNRELTTPKLIAPVYQNLTPAAVLLPLYYKAGELHLLLTRRTDHLKHHKGQIAFPGGKFDLSDQDLATTALRETHEEVGIAPQDVEIWGRFQPLPTITSYYIFPFVGFFEYPYSFQPNSDEIDTLIEVPLRHLQDKRYQRQETRDYQGKTYPLYFFEYQNWTIWGITGQLLRDFLDLLESRD